MILWRTTHKIFTTDVTQLEFHWSPVVGESTEANFKEIVSTHADANEKMQTVVVAVSEVDYLSNIQPNLGSSLYDSIDSELNVEDLAYYGPYWDV